MNIPLRTLLVEDTERDGLLVLEALRWEGFEPDFLRVQTAAEMETALATKEWDVVLCDYSLPGFDALAAIQLVQDAKLDLPVIVVSGTIGEEKAVEAIKAGATDYLMKDRLPRLGAAVSQALDKKRLRNEQKLAEEALRNEQALFNSLFNTTPDHIYFKDRESRFLRINEVLAHRFGLRSASEAVGKTDGNFFTEKHAQQAYHDEQGVMPTGKPII